MQANIAPKNINFSQTKIIKKPFVLPSQLLRPGLKNHLQKSVFHHRFDKKFRTCEIEKYQKNIMFSTVFTSWICKIHTSKSRKKTVAPAMQQTDSENDPKSKTSIFHQTYAKFTSQKRENDHFRVGLQTPLEPPRDPPRPPWDLPSPFGPLQPPPGILFSLFS